MNQSQSQGRLLLSVKQLSHMTCVIILQHFFSVENPAFKHIQDQIPTHESLKDLIVRIQPFGNRQSCRQSEMGKEFSLSLMELHSGKCGKIPKRNNFQEYHYFQSTCKDH